MSEAVGEIQAAVDKEQLATMIHAVVFKSGILKKVVDKQIELHVQRAAEDYVKKELPTHIERAVGETLNSEAMKEFIDSKFRAITLYLKTDVIPSAVKRSLKQQSGD